ISQRRDERRYRSAGRRSPHAPPRPPEPSMLVWGVWSRDPRDTGGPVHVPDLRRVRLDETGQRVRSDLRCPSAREKRHGYLGPERTQMGLRSGAHGFGGWPAGSRKERRMAEALIEINGGLVAYELIGPDDGETVVITPGGRFSKDVGGIHELA